MKIMGWGSRTTSCCACSLVALLLLAHAPKSWVRWIATAQDTALGMASMDQKAGVRFASYSFPPADTEALRVVLKAADGVYVTPESGTGDRSSKAWPATVLMTIFNQAYGDMFFNWACHVRRVGPQRLKYVAWAQDRLAAQMLTGQADGLAADGGAHFFFSAHMADQLGSVLYATRFRSNGFNRLTNFKLVAVRLILEAGYAVCLADVDVILLADPWPTFQGAAKCDYEYAPNRGCADSQSDLDLDAYREGNTGFHLLQPRPAVLEVLRHTLARAERDQATDDQTLMWSHIHALHRNGKAVHHAAQGRAADRSPASAPQNRTRAPLSYCSLPRNAHKVGGCFTTAAEVRGLVTAHANFVSTANRKVDKMRRVGLWALTDETAVCVQPAGGVIGWVEWLWGLAFYRPARVAYLPPGRQR